METFIEQHPGAALPVTVKILRSGAQDDFTAAALFQSQHRNAELRSLTRELLQDAILMLPTAGGWRNVAAVV